MKNLSKFLLIIFLMFLWNSCNQDAVKPLTPQTKEKVFKINPKEEPFLLEKVNLLLKSSGGRIASGNDISWETATKVIDEPNNKILYTFKYTESSKTSEFNNFVLTETNSVINGYVLTYSPDQEWLNLGLFDLSDFSGTITGLNLVGDTISNTSVLHGRTLPIADNTNGRIKTAALPPFPDEDGCYKLIYSTATGRYWWQEITCSGGPIEIGGEAPGGDTPPDESGGGTGSGAGGSSTGGSGNSGSGSGSIGNPNPEEPDDNELGPGVIPPSFEEFVEKQLNDLLLENPTALLEIPCDQLPKWQALAQNEASQDIKDKINQLDNNADWFEDWAIQALNEANGTIVNMDYFSVNVTTLPNNPATGSPFTPEGFLDYFRKNINDFAEGSTFSPYCETPAICTQETELWNSSDPTGAIIYIDIPADDGVVVCSEYASSYWYFMTLEAPGAGNHPVSGTRQFGFESNGNGGYSFFVRGVDRFDSNIVENTLYMATLGENPFFGADALWSSFQNKLNEFANNNGGNATVNEPIKYRPDWDKVNQILQGDKPISDLGCK